MTATPATFELSPDKPQDPAASIQSASLAVDSREMASSAENELRELLTKITRAKQEWEATADSLPQLLPRRQKRIYYSGKSRGRNMGPWFSATHLRPSFPPAASPSMFSILLLSPESSARFGCGYQSWPQVRFGNLRSCAQARCSRHAGANPGSSEDGAGHAGHHHRGHQ